LHQWDTFFQIDHQNTRKHKDEEILDSIISIWYGDKDFTQEKIQKSFKVTGISTNLDGSEQNLVAKHEEKLRFFLAFSQINCFFEVFFPSVGGYSL